jgi:hypothetical protein
LPHAQYALEKTDARSRRSRSSRSDQKGEIMSLELRIASDVDWAPRFNECCGCGHALWSSWWARRVRAALVLVGGLCATLAGGAVMSGVLDSSMPSKPPGRHTLLSLPVAAEGPISAALGRDESAYHVVNLVGRNPAQHLSARFRRSTVAITAGSTHFDLGFDGFGRAGAISPLGASSPRASDNRVSYAYGLVTEWWANGPLGLEQGFDVARRPAGSGPLTFSLAVPGKARLDRNTLLLPGGLQYAGLLASDAHGRMLHASLELHAGHLQIQVDDRAAEYPVRVDPYLQQTELTASDGAADDEFGLSVAVSGDTAVVGAPGHQVGANPGQGAAYVFVRPAAGWAHAVQTAELTASDGAAGDLLGNAVAISDDTIVAGSFHTVGANIGQGAAYVFTKPTTGWANATQTAELTASDGAPNDLLSSIAVGISGDTVVAGSENRTVATSGGQTNFEQGAVYVFVRPRTGWTNATQTAELTASDGAAQDFLGGAVAVSGDTVVAGAAGHSDGTNARQGAAYVFVQPSTGWATAAQTAELTASDGAPRDDLGDAVAISGDTIVAGAPEHQVGLDHQGAAYVYTRPFFGWQNRTQTAELTASDGATGDLFGATVAASGDLISATAVAHTVGDHAAQGAAYVFRRPGTGWVDTTQAAELTASDGAPGDVLGVGISASGTTVTGGAPFHTVGSQARQGAAYVFGPPPTITLSAPANGATYTQGQTVAASYSCGPPPGTTITRCAGPVADGSAIDTTTLGQHTFTATATDADGITATQTATYSVAPPPATKPPGRATGRRHASPSPLITALRQSAAFWREDSARRLTRFAKKVPVGTTFSFHINQQAHIKLAFRKQTNGRDVRGRCVAQTANNEHESRCTRMVDAGTLRLSAQPGAHKIHFDGRVSRTRKLKPGRYALTIVATNSAGHPSNPRTLKFTIVRPAVDPRSLP